jgi:hypothetical protein
MRVRYGTTVTTAHWGAENGSGPYALIVAHSFTASDCSREHMRRCNVINTIALYHTSEQLVAAPTTPRRS